MKNCAGCDNTLAENATFCYVCHTRVGDLKPRPGYGPSKYSEYTGIIVTGVVIFVLALAAFLTFAIDDQTADIIGYGLTGISVTIGLVKLLGKAGK